MDPKQDSRCHLLIVRFSSFGDIVQNLWAAMAFKGQYPDSQISWLARSDFADLVGTATQVDHVLAYSRKAGLSGLCSLAWNLAKNDFTHVYDAHNNLRSLIFCAVLRLAQVMQSRPSYLFIRRPKNRWLRFLLFKLHINRFEKPFRGARSYTEPLEAWKIFFDFAKPSAQPALAGLNFSKELPRIIFAPSAAWPMKRWPIEYWKELVRLLPDVKITLLGGPEDQFCEEIRQLNPNQIENLAGRTTLLQSAALTAQAKLVVSADTGLLHVADLAGRPTLALIGPTAFGYPSRPSSRVLEVDLPCKPCSKDGRGGCVNKVYQKCMLDITPALVAQQARALLKEVTI